MLFARDQIKTVPLPSDPSVQVTIQKLSWIQRKSAQQAAQLTNAKNYRQYVETVGDEFVDKALAKKAADEAAAAADSENASAKPEAPADPLVSHDQLTVLVCGIQSWTAGADVTRDNLEQLSDEDAEFLAREILAWTLPPAVTEEQEKNGN
jgi:NADPH:quinone reductase-like Zn-dependent oxidoreductase